MANGLDLESAACYRPIFLSDKAWTVLEVRTMQNELRVSFLAHFGGLLPVCPAYCCMKPILMCNAGWSSIEAEIGFAIDECHRLSGPMLWCLATLRRYGTLQSMDVKDLKDIPFSENSQREMVNQSISVYRSAEHNEQFNWPMPRERASCVSGEFTKPASSPQLFRIIGRIIM